MTLISLVLLKQYHTGAMKSSTVSYSHDCNFFVPIYIPYCSLLLLDVCMHFFLLYLCCKAVMVLTNL